MGYLLTILIFLVNPQSAPGRVVFQVTGGIALQNQQPNLKPLTLTQVERLIQNPSINAEDTAAKDQAIAVEILRRGVDFRMTDSTLQNLRKLGAGPQTVQALERLKKVVILVANFSNDENKYGVTESLLDRLTELERLHSDIEVQPLGESITTQQGRKVAVTTGRKHKANIVIWGRVDRSDEAALITAHFEIIQGSQHTGALSVPGTTQRRRIKLPELKNFTIQTLLSNEMATITLFAAGLSRLEAQDYKAAITHFTEAIRQGNLPNKAVAVNRSDILTARGVAYLYDQGFNSKNALNDFGEAIRANNKNSQARGWRVYVNISQRNNAQVIADSQRLLEDEPGVDVQTISQLLIGIVYLLKDEPAQASPYFDKVIRIAEGYSANAVVAATVGMAYVYKRDFSRGHQYLDRSIELSNVPVEKAQFRGLKGGAYLFQKEFDKAIKEFNESLRLDPQQLHTYVHIGHAYAGKRDYKQAIKNYSQYLEHERDSTTFRVSSAEVLVWRGEAYYHEGNKDKALEDFSRAINQDPRLTRALYARARFYFEMGQWDKSLSDYNEIIKLEPNDAAAFLSRGNSHTRKGFLDEALKDYNEAINLNPNNAQAYLARGANYAVKGARDLAILDFQKVLEIADDHQLKQEAQKQLQLLGVK